MVEKMRSGIYVATGKTETKPNYLNEDHSPFNVVFKTSRILVEGLQNHDTITESGSEYITAYTFPFIKRAAQGAELVQNNEYQISDNPIDTAQSVEAYAFSNIIFAYIAVACQATRLDHNRATLDIVKAPSGPAEAQNRFEEMHEVMDELLANNTLHEPFERNRPAALRTYLYFIMGNQLHVKEAISEHEKEQKEALDKKIKQIEYDKQVTATLLSWMND